MAVVSIETFSSLSGGDLERECARTLEGGNVLLFPRTPFSISDADRAFLLERRQTDAGYHKNIAYRPGTDRVTGVARQHHEDAEKLREVLRRYSKTVIDFTARLIALRRDYPMLRAGNFLYGEDTPAEGLKDIEWWDERGEFAFLHKMNPVRMQFIRDKLVEVAQDADPDLGTDGSDILRGLDVLDVGSGGGLLSEVRHRTTRLTAPISMLAEPSPYGR